MQQTRLGLGLTKRRIVSLCKPQILTIPAHLQPFSLQLQSNVTSFPMTYLPRSPQHLKRTFVTTLSSKLLSKKTKSIPHVSKQHLKQHSKQRHQLLTNLHCLAPYTKTIRVPPITISAAPFMWDEFKLQQFVDFIIQANPRDIYADTPLTGNAHEIPSDLVQHPRVQLFEQMSKRTTLEYCFEGILRFIGHVVKVLVSVFKMTPLRVLYPYIESLINNSHLYYKIDEWLYLTPDERLYAAYLNYKLTLLYGRIISMAKTFIENKGDHHHPVTNTIYLSEFDEKHPNDSLLLLEYDLEKHTDEYVLYQTILDDFNSHLLDLQMDSIISKHVQHLQQLEYEEQQQEKLDIASKQIPVENSVSLLESSLSSTHISTSPSTIESDTPYSALSQEDLQKYTTLLDPTTNISLLLSSSSLPISPTTIKLDSINQHAEEHFLLYALAQEGPFLLGPNGLPIFRTWEPDWTELGQLDPFSDNILPDYDPCLWTNDPETNKVVMRSSLWKRGYDSLYDALKAVNQTISPLQNPQLLQEGTSLRLFHPNIVQFPKVPELLKLLTTDILQFQLYRDGYPFLQTHGHILNSKKPYTPTSIGLQDLLMIERLQDPAEIEKVTKIVARQSLLTEMRKERQIELHHEQILHKVKNFLFEKNQNLGDSDSVSPFHLLSQQIQDINEMVDLRNQRLALKRSRWKIGEGMEKLDDLIWTHELGDENAKKPSQLTSNDYDKYTVPKMLFHWSERGLNGLRKQLEEVRMKKKNLKLQKQLRKSPLASTITDSISSSHSTDINNPKLNEICDETIKRLIYRIKTKHDYPQELSQLQNSLYFGTEIANSFLEHDYQQVVDMETLQHRARYEKMIELERQKKEQHEIRREIKAKELHHRNKNKQLQIDPTTGVEKITSTRLSHNNLSRNVDIDGDGDDGDDDDDDDDYDWFNIESKLPPLTITTSSYGNNVQKNRTTLLNVAETALKMGELSEQIRTQYFPHISENEFHLYKHAIGASQSELNRGTSSNQIEEGFLAPQLPPEIPKWMVVDVENQNNDIPISIQTDPYRWSPMQDLLNKIKTGELGLTLHQIKEQEKSELALRHDLCRQRDLYYQQLEDQGVRIYKPDGKKLPSHFDDIITRLDQRIIETTFFYKTILRTISIRPKIVETVIRDEFEQQQEALFIAQQEQRREEQQKLAQSESKTESKTDNDSKSFQRHPQGSTTPATTLKSLTRLKKSVHPKDFDQTLKQNPHLDSSTHHLPSRLDKQFINPDDLKPFEASSDYIAGHRRRDTFNTLKTSSSIFHAIENDEKIQDVNFFSNPPETILSEPQNARLMWILQPLYDMTPRELIDMYDLLSAHQACMASLPYNSYNHYEYLLYKKRLAQEEEYPLIHNLLANVQLQSLISPMYNPIFISPQYEINVLKNQQGLEGNQSESDSATQFSQAQLPDFIQRSIGQAFTAENMDILKHRHQMEHLQRSISENTIEELTKFTDVIDEHVQLISAINHRHHGDYIHTLHGVPNRGANNRLELPYEMSDLVNFEEFYQTIPITNGLLDKKGIMEHNEFGSDDLRNALLEKATTIGREDHIYEDTPSLSTDQLQMYDRLMTSLFQKYPHDDYDISNININNANPTFQLLFRRTAAAFVSSSHRLSKRHSQKDDDKHSSSSYARNFFQKMESDRNSYYGPEGNLTRQKVLRDLSEHEFLHGIDRFSENQNPNFFDDFNVSIPLNDALFGRQFVDGKKTTNELISDLDRTLDKIHKTRAGRVSIHQHQPSSATQSESVPKNVIENDLLETEKMTLNHDIYRPNAHRMAQRRDSPSISLLSSDSTGFFNRAWTYLYHESLLSPLLQYSISAITPDFIRSQHKTVKETISWLTTPTALDKKAISASTNSPIDFTQPPQLNANFSPNDIIYDDISQLELESENLDVLKAVEAAQRPTNKPTERELMLFYQQHSYNFMYSIMQHLVEQHINTTFKAYLTLHKAYQHEATISTIPALLFSNTIDTSQENSLLNFLSRPVSQKYENDVENPDGGTFIPTFLYGIHFPSGDPRFFKFVSDSKGKDPLSAYLTYFKQQLMKDFLYYSEEDKLKLKNDFGILDDEDGNLTFPSGFYDFFDEQEQNKASLSKKHDDFSSPTSWSENALDNSMDEQDGYEKNHSFVNSLLNRYGITPYGAHLLTFIELLGGDDRPLNPAVIQQVSLAEPVLNRYGIQLSSLLTQIHFIQHSNKDFLLSSIANTIQNEIAHIHHLSSLVPILPSESSLSSHQQLSSTKQLNTNTTNGLGMTLDNEPTSLINLPIHEHPLYHAEQNNLVTPSFESQPLSLQHHYTTLKRNHYNGMKKLRQRYTWLNLEDITALDVLIGEALKVSKRNIHFYRPMFWNDGSVLSPRF